MYRTKCTTFIIRWKTWNRRKKIILGGKELKGEMSFTYHIDSSAGILFIVGEGAITQAERLDTMRAWLSDPDYRPGLHTLCDFSRATSTPSLPDLREIIAIINQNAPLIGRKKLAVVATKASTFGVARQFEVLAEATSLNVEIFTDREAAIAWLRED